MGAVQSDTSTDAAVTWYHAIPDQKSALSIRPPSEQTGARWMAGADRSHQIMFNAVHSFITAAGTCHISRIGDDGIELMKSGNIADCHMRMFESAEVPSTRSVACNGLAVAEVLVKRKEVHSDSLRGSVLHVSIGSESAIMKYTSPLQTKHGTVDPSDPYAAFGKRDDSIVEPIMLSIITMSRIAGINPFVPITFGSFPCRMTLHDDGTADRKLRGIACIQELIPLDFRSIQEQFVRDKSQFLGTLCLIACASFVCTHICGIVHNDLHVNNVRFRRSVEDNVTVNRLGKKYSVRTSLFPVFIDWGMSCSRFFPRLCSGYPRKLTDFYVGIAPLADVDVGQYLRSLSVLTSAFDTILMNKPPTAADALSARDVVNNLVISHVMLSAWYIVDDTASSHRYYPPIDAWVRSDGSLAPTWVDILCDHLWNKCAPSDASLAA